LQAAAVAGSQIREHAEQHATLVRRKALDDAQAIDQEFQSLAGVIWAGREQVIKASDNIRSVEAEVMSCAHTARREALAAIARLADECARVRNLQQHHGVPAAFDDVLAVVDANLQALRAQVQRAEWPLPTPIDPSSSLLEVGAVPTAADLTPAVAATPGDASAPAPELRTIPVPVNAAAGVGQNGSAPLRVAVLGAGYVGLTTAACLARLGHSVVCTDPPRRSGRRAGVPVGTCRDVAAWLGRPDVAVVSNPEFLREGSALADFFHPDRVVIGADDPQTAAKVSELYRSLDTEILVMRPESAELVKYASNGFLATRLSYVNYIATLCELVGADVGDVIRGMGSDCRIGPLFLEPGPGWGGSCFPKDAAALVSIASHARLDFTLLREAITSNQVHETRLVDRIEELAGGSVQGRTVAVWGLTFKARTDDQRESPSLAIAAQLRARGATIQAYDPTVHDPLADIRVCPTPVAACEHASVLFVATEWDELRQVDLSDIRRVMDRPAILDGRHMLDAAQAARNGFTYAAVGRPTVVPVDAAGANSELRAPSCRPASAEQGTVPEAGRPERMPT